MLLRSVYASSAPAAEGDKLPGRIRIAKWGHNKSVKADYVVNETTARALPHVQKALGFDTVDLDFNHNTVPGSKPYLADKEPRKRAAFGPLEVVPGEGIFLSVREWTPEGEAAVKGRHFQDLSPAIVTNSVGEVVFIHSAALCRQGCTEGLELELNSADFGDLAARLSTHSAAFSPAPSPETKPTMDKFKALLLTLLGLPETADDAAIETAAKAHAAKVDAANKVAGQVQTMSADIASLKELVTGGERTRLVNEAILAGKIVPQSIAELPIDSLKKVLGDLPPGMVPLDRRTPEGIKTHSSDVVSGESIAEAEVARQLGRPVAKK
jgi:phage I-like protein